MKTVTTLVDKLMVELESWLEALVTSLPNLAVALLVVVIFAYASRWVKRDVERLLLRVSDNQPIASCTSAPELSEQNDQTASNSR